MSWHSETKPNPKRDVFSDRYARVRDRLSPSFKRVADFIDTNRIDAMRLSAVDLARTIGTSDATVVRAVQALGFHGLADLRAELAAAFRGRNAPSDNLARTLTDIGEDTQAALDDVLNALTSALESMRATDVRQAMMNALRLLHNAERIVIFGIGPTAHIAAYFASRLRRKGRKQAVLNQTGAGLADQLLDLQHGDVILMLAYGTIYREAKITVHEARRLQLPIILVTDRSERSLAHHTDVVLLVPRGRSERVALHGTTLACMEMLLLGLATLGRGRAMTALANLDRLRDMTYFKRGNLGTRLTDDTE